MIGMACFIPVGFSQFSGAHETELREFQGIFA